MYVQSVLRRQQCVPGGSLKAESGDKSGQFSSQALVDKLSNVYGVGGEQMAADIQTSYDSILYLHSSITVVVVHIVIGLRYLD